MIFLEKFFQNFSKKNHLSLYILFGRMQKSKQPHKQELFRWLEMIIPVLKNVNEGIFQLVVIIQVFLAARRV